MPRYTGCPLLGRIRFAVFRPVNLAAPLTALSPFRWLFSAGRREWKCLNTSTWCPLPAPRGVMLFVFTANGHQQGLQACSMQASCLHGVRLFCFFFFFFISSKLWPHNSSYHLPARVHSPFNPHAHTNTRTQRGNKRHMTLGEAPWQVCVCPPVWTKQLPVSPAKSPRSRACVSFCCSSWKCVAFIYFYE